MKYIFLSIFLSTCAFINAQVGIGTVSPKQSSILDIESNNKGILIPRVDLKSLKQLLEPNINNEHALLIFNNGADLPQGFYYWKSDIVNSVDDGSWVMIGTEKIPGIDNSVSSNFFYMPSIVIDTSNPNQNVLVTRNLYSEYKAQFTGQLYNVATNTFSPNPDFIKSAGAPVAIPILPNPTDLYYYITDYDKTALSDLSIDENGILTYKVISSGTDYSFVNIVFVVK